jgi:EamA domain-containing membrane protein RarD
LFFTFEKVKTIINFISPQNEKTMKPYLANLINALILVVVGGLAYLEKDAVTALIPVVIGTIFWLYTNKLKEGDKTASHVVVLLTFLLIIGLIMSMRRELQVDDTMGVIRNLIMLSSCTFALVVFIQSFREARMSKV